MIYQVAAESDAWLLKDWVDAMTPGWNKKTAPSGICAVLPCGAAFAVLCPTGDGDLLLTDTARKLLITVTQFKDDAAYIAAAGPDAVVPDQAKARAKPDTSKPLAEAQGKVAAQVKDA